MSRRPPAPPVSFDPIAGRFAEIGRLLREGRQQRGEDLYDVADYLRIKPSYLFAIEEGDLSALPGRTYAMGFLRTYADHLGYDGAEVVRGLKAAAQAETAPALAVPQPVVENRRPGLGVLLLALLLAALAYGGWHVVQSGGGDALAKIGALPGGIGQYVADYFKSGPDEAGSASAAGRPAFEPLAASEPRPPVGSTARSTGTPSTSGMNGLMAGQAAASASLSSTPPTEAGAVSSRRDAGQPDAGSLPSVSGGASEVLSSLALDAEVERAASASRPLPERAEEEADGTAGALLAGLGEQPAAAGAPASEVGRVVLVARESSWIQVQSPARDYVRSLTLEPGASFAVPDRGDLALWTGNAGGLEIWVDGQRVGILGRSGAVLRDVPLAPEALRARLN